MNNKYLEYLVNTNGVKEVVIDCHANLSRASAALANAALTNNQVAIGTAVATIIEAANTLRYITTGERLDALTSEARKAVTTTKTKK